MWNSSCIANASCLEYIKRYRVGNMPICKLNFKVCILIIFMYLQTYSRWYIYKSEFRELFTRLNVSLHYTLNLDSQTLICTYVVRSSWCLDRLNYFRLWNKDVIYEVPTTLKVSKHSHQMNLHTNYY